MGFGVNMRRPSLGTRGGEQASRRFCAIHAPIPTGPWFTFLPSFLFVSLLIDLQESSCLRDISTLSVTLIKLLFLRWTLRFEFGAAGLAVQRQLDSIVISNACFLLLALSSVSVLRKTFLSLK